MENEINNTTNEPEVQEPQVEAEVQETPVETEVQEMPVEAETEETVIEPEAQETVVEAAVQETPIETEVQAIPVENAPVETKKSFKALKIALCIAIPLILIVSAVILNYNNLVGFFIKQFGSPSDYLKFVETKSYTQYIDKTTDLYSTYLNNIKENKSGTSQIKLNIGENAQSTLDSFIFSGANFDINKLKDISFNVDFTNAKDIQSGNMDILLANENILSFATQFNLAENKCYIALKELTDKVIGIDLTQQQSDTTTPSVNQSLKAPEYLPDSKALNKLITKYTDIIVSNIKDVSKTEQNTKVENIEQKCTVLEYKLNNALVTDIAKAVLKEVKNDAEFKSVYESFEKAAVGADEAGSTYTTFIQNVESLLTSMESAEATADDTVIANIKCYVNSNNEVIGRCIEIPSSNLTIEFVTVHKGSDFETKCTFLSPVSDTENQEVSFTGKGNDKNNKTNATYTLSINGSEAFNIELVDFVSQEITKGIASGTIRLTPNMAYLTQQGGSDENVTTLLALLNPTLEMNLQATKDKSTADFNLLSNGNLLIGFNMNTVLTEAKQVESIDTENAIDITNNTELNEFLTSIDMDKLIEKLEKLSIPESVINQLKQYATLMQYTTVM